MSESAVRGAVTRISGEELLELFQEMGFVAELDAFGDGTPVLRFQVEGLKCLVLFYGIEGDGRARSLQFRAIFSDLLPLQKINEWHRSKRFPKAYLDTDGNVTVDMDVFLDGGVSREHIKESISSWRSGFLSFLSYASENIVGDRIQSSFPDSKGSSNRAMMAERDELPPVSPTDTGLKGE